MVSRLESPSDGSCICRPREVCSQLLTLGKSVPKIKVYRRQDSWPGSRCLLWPSRHPMEPPCQCQAITGGSTPWGLRNPEPRIAASRLWRGGDFDFVSYSTGTTNPKKKDRESTRLK